MESSGTPTPPAGRPSPLRRRRRRPPPPAGEPSAETAGGGWRALAVDPVRSRSPSPAP